MGALVINHNTQAINTHRNMLNVDKRMKNSLEHLSSGERVVRAADGAAALMISEQMRAQVASVTQAMRNAETSVSMVQTTEAALNEVNNLLVGVRQLAVHAANEGANDDLMLAADQFEIANALQSIDRIAEYAQFGTKKLLDGSLGVNGVAAGKGMMFMEATTKTRPSPDEGYEVKTTQVATKAYKEGMTELTQELIDSGVDLTIQEGGRVAKYTTQKGEDVSVVVNKLMEVVRASGLKVNVDFIPNEEDPHHGRLTVTHNDVGSANKFVVVSSTAGVLSSQEGLPETVDNAKDIRGTINNQLAYGVGNTLTAAPGTQADGLKVAYTGPLLEDPNQPVGRVNVTQKSLVFQIGGNVGQKVKVSLEAVSTRTLARNLANVSGYTSLHEVDVRTAQGAEDTMRMVEKAIDDINKQRATLGAIQKNALESQLRSLNVAREELISAESVIRDADMAAEMSELTRNQVIMQSSVAMMGQANQISKHVLSLLNQ
ncbi:MAG: flagellin [Deltaproteobacteria bacterium]|nr:flagellin [Deltaproteobacteria bacterium]